MIDFIVSNSMYTIILFTVAVYFLIFLWIKTKKSKFLYSFVGLLIFGISSSIGLLYYTNNPIVSHSSNNVFLNSKSKMIEKLKEIRDSENNEKYTVFREMINAFINDKDFDYEDFQTVIAIDKNIAFKRGLQMDKQEQEDLSVLLELTKTKPEY